MPTTTPHLHPPHEPPDDDIPVLLRIKSHIEPIWIGFRDADSWRSVDGSLITDPIIGWIHIEDAARIIDTHTTRLPMRSLRLRGHRRNLPHPHPVHPEVPTLQ